LKHRLSLLIALMSASLIYAGCSPSGGGRRSSSKDKDADTVKQPGDPAVTGGNTGDPAVNDGGGDTGTDGIGDPVETDGGDDTGAGVDTTGVDNPPSCTPSSVACDGTDVVACKGDGSGWYVIESCANGTSCSKETGTCIATCTANCLGKQCGDDGCGGSCGTCSGDMTCSGQGKCIGGGTGGNCVAAGTGVNVGQKVKDISWTDSNNQTLKLHSYCGSAPAVFLIETASW